MVIGRLSDLMVFKLLAGGADVIHRGKEREREREEGQEAGSKSKIRLTIIIPRFNEPFAVCVHRASVVVWGVCVWAVWPLLFLSVSAFQLSAFCMTQGPTGRRQGNWRPQSPAFFFFSVTCDENITSILQAKVD
jgi:hypothetical protein